MTDLQPFFKDNENQIASKYTLNRYLMYIDVIMVFNTLMQQINYIHFLKNAVPIGVPFDIETFIEQLDGLLHAAYKNKEDMRERVREVVTTYNPG